MRAANKFLVHSSTESSPTSTRPKCDEHSCPRWPYSSSNNFEAKAALILIIIFSLVIFGLTLNAAIRCLVLRHRRRAETTTTTTTTTTTQQPKTKASVCSTTEPPTILVVFSAGMKQQLADQCTICLSDFIEGEGIQLLPRCRHGFHSECIEEWLASHCSCPTCRTICHPTSSHAADSPQATA